MKPNARRLLLLLAVVAGCGGIVVDERRDGSTPDGGGVSDVRDGSASCEPVYAKGVGLCEAIVGAIWDGSKCVELVGCSCEGPGCSKLYAIIELCERGQAHCKR